MYFEQVRKDISLGYNYVELKEYEWRKSTKCVFMVLLQYWNGAIYLSSEAKANNKTKISSSNDSPFSLHFLYKESN